MESSNLFLKARIKNRFIAVKYAKIPKNTKNSFTIKPLCDGLGFKIDLQGLNKIGFEKEDIFYLKKELRKINRIIDLKYSFYKKNESPNLISKKSNDRLIFISFGLSLIFFFFIQMSNNKADLKLFLIGFLGYLAILFFLSIFLCRSFFLKINYLPSFTFILPEFLDPVFKEVKASLNKKGFDFVVSEDYFWIQISNKN